MQIPELLWAVSKPLFVPVDGKIKISNTLDRMALFRKTFVFIFVVFTLGIGSLGAAQSNPEALRRAQMARRQSPILPSTNPSTPVSPAPLGPAQQQVATMTQQPLRPAQMAAIAPRISFQNGLLTVVAENSNFNDVLNGIRAATGMKIESSGGNAGERVAAKIGPAPVRDVLLSLLEGSRYDFVMLGSSTDPERIERVVLSPKSSGTGTVASSQPGSSAASVATDVNADDNDTPETDDNNEGFAPAAQPEPAQPAAGQQPGIVIPGGQPPANAPGVSGSPDAQQSVKTPEQLLQDLRNMEQQRQQQQQQTPPGTVDPNQRTPRPPR